MGGTHFNRSELILVTAVDFFTAEVLINNYVMPSVQILDWRTEYSGVTENHIREAILEGEIPNSRQEAINYTIKKGKEIGLKVVANTIIN